MNVRTKTKTDRPYIVVVSSLIATVILLISVVSPFAVSATNVLSRFNQLSNPRPGEESINRIGFTVTDFSVPLGSLRFEFCENNPITGTPCTPPNGLDASGVSILSETGETGFSVDSSSTVNEVVLSRSPVLPVQADLVYELQGIINPSDLGTYYLRIYTYETGDGTGPSLQSGGVALTTSLEVDFSTEVPPYITFCASVTITGLDCTTASTFFINLGEFSTNTTRTATSQMLAATNAPNGYTIRMNGTTLTSGNQTIPALAARTASQPGTGQFGANLRANTAPSVGLNPVGPGTASPTTDYNIPNQFKFASNNVVVNSPVGSDTRKFTVSYIANIDGDQPPGIYTTTVQYISLANF